MRKRILTSLLTASAYALALALALAACGPKSGPAASLPPSGGASSCLSPSGSIPPQPASPASPQDLGADAAKAYRKALEEIYSQRTYPNGDPVETFQMENNDFALFDVDGDGAAELIYQNDDSTMAGMMTSIFSFDSSTGKLYLELSGFAAMIFYDNGVIQVEASHNHGLSGRDDFWPFTLYQYDSGGDGYLMIGSVDAWDKDTFPADHEGSPFPDEIDQDGDGTIYLIAYGGQEVTTTPLDGPEYERWLKDYTAGAAELDIPWQAMTLENIQAVAP
jgi:hypothetical protein